MGDQDRQLKQGVPECRLKHFFKKGSEFMSSSRRDFLADAGFAGVGFWVAGNTVSASPKMANDKLNFACIGVGGKGSSDADHVAQLGNIVAICDVDEDTLGKKKKQEAFEKAKVYYDFRKMFSELGKSIDAVTVSTPDHTHAVASLMAMRLGKHVYCQKPLTRTVAEARLMRTVAKEKNVCTQMGNQGTAENGVRQAAEIVWAGLIGNVKDIHVWTNRPVWNQAPDIVARPGKVDPVPKHLHWDEWLGPAPYRPYANGVYHDFNWRGWWDFGTGAMGDMACHTANMAFLACKLHETYPTKVRAESGTINAETFPEWARITYEYPARGSMPPCTLTWYEGREGGRHSKTGKRVLPPKELIEPLTKGRKLADSGSIIVGDKGIIFSPNDYGARYELLDLGFKKLEATFPPATLARNNRGDFGMKAEWAEAIRAGKPAIAMSNFEYAAALTENMLVGNVSLRLGGKELLWDGPNMRFTNCSEAAQFVSQETRRGWEL
jgi:predicted dehydrogenase